MENSLTQAYSYINAGELSRAENVLESLVRADPTNVEAWEAFMQISKTCDELDNLCNRVLPIAGFTSFERESILDYYYFLRQKMRQPDEEVDDHRMIKLELMDQFSYTLKEQHHSSIKVSNADFMQWLTWLLPKAIIIPYFALLSVGIKLVSLRNNFGYWIIMVIAISILANLLDMIFPVFRANYPSDDSSVETTEKQGTPIARRTNLAPRR